MPHLAHRIEGRGPRRCIALHGWFGDQRSFDALLPWVDLQRYSWLLPDLRGYGDAVDVGTVTPDSIAADVLALADALDWEQFDLIGHSMSGKFAMRIAQREPERVQRIVAVTPVSPGPVPFDAATRTLFESAATQPERRAAILNHSTAMRLPPCWSETMLRRSLQSCRPEVMQAYLQAWVDGDCNPEMANVTQRVLVVVGEHDPVITTDNVRASLLSRLRNGVLETLPHAGHYPMDEMPLALAGLVMDFLGRDRE